MTSAVMVWIDRGWDDWADGPASDSEAEVERDRMARAEDSVAESERIGRQLVSGWQDSDQGSAEEAEESPVVKDPGDASGCQSA